MREREIENERKRNRNERKNEINYLERTNREI